MTAIPSQDFTAYSGGGVTLKLQLKDATGAFEDLTGREFRWAVTDSLGATVAVATSTITTIDGQPAAVMRFGGATNATLLEGKGLAEDYRHMCAEVLGADYDPKLVGRYLVRTGPDLDGGIDGGEGAEDSATVVVLMANSSLLQLQSMGARGISAAEGLYQAGLIAAPTSGAFATYLRSQSVRNALIFGG